MVSIYYFVQAPNNDDNNPHSQVANVTPDPVSVTVGIQIMQIESMDSDHDTLSIYPFRLAFGLSNGRIVVVRLIDFLQHYYWGQSDSTKSSHSRWSKYFLDGHRGPITSLIHPASAERHLQFGCASTPTISFSTNLDSFQFNPNFLLSGGADFTVRLWNLNPWPDAELDIQTGIALSHSSMCLAVFDCHSSPCIGFAMGPPKMAILNQMVGNPRLVVSD